MTYTMTLLFPFSNVPSILVNATAEFVWSYTEWAAHAGPFDYVPYSITVVPTITSGWEVLEAEVSQRTGDLFVCGINHESTDPLFRRFSWHINSMGLQDDRFSFQNCKFGPGAKARLEQLRKKV